MDMPCRFKHDQFRVSFMGYSAKLAQWSNEIRGKGESGQPISPETVEMLYHGVMEGLRLLSQFTSQVIEQSAWKYAKACPEVCISHR